MKLNMLGKLFSIRFYYKKIKVSAKDVSILSSLFNQNRSWALIASSLGKPSNL